MSNDLVDCVEGLAMGFGGKAEVFEGFEDLGLGFGKVFAVELVEEHLEASVGGDLGVELANGAGGGVAGVGVDFLAEFFLELV